MRNGLWVAAAALLLLATAGAAAAETAAVEAETEPAPGFVSMYKAIGMAAAAAFTMAISVLGAGYAVGRIGSAALGAAAEKPELLTRSVLLVALAEGLAVLGFLIALLLVQKIA
jgi:V/A-type H+-transporting ATPase subunit K